jgi:hypothetical protein
MAQLVLTSDTLAGTPATGTLEYNGQFFGTDSAAARAQMQRITLSTAVASTSGTSIDFTSLPAWVKRITVMFQGVSTNGTSNLLIQIGSVSLVTTTYVGSTALVGAATANSVMSTGFMLTPSQGAATTTNGNVILCLQNSSTNLWTENGVLSSSDAANTAISGGHRALSGALDQVRITTVGGTNTFDAGSINILYEG